jgi:hypothetical protein
MRRSFALLAVLVAALRARAEAAEAEPTLVEAQQAAMRRAGGPAEDDASREARARNAHWAPVLRGLVGGRDDERTRDGEMRRDPLRWTDRGQSTAWAVTATWDLPQVIYAREEAQLAHAHLHLEKARQAASREAVRLYLERRDKQRALLSAPPGELQRRLQLEILRLTADLDALTGGLFRAALAREQQAAMPPPSAAPAAQTAPAPLALPLPLSPKETR